MGVTQRISNTLIAGGRAVGRLRGYELAVELSDHSIETTMERPSQDGKKAWDETMYKHGNVFIDGQANPIKPKIEYHEQLQDSNTVDVDVSDAGDGDDESHIKMISSPRYRDYMRQHLISQLLNPREQWRLVVYAVIALGIFMAINIVLTAAAAGMI